MTRYRVVCGDGNVVREARDERMARIYAAYEDRSFGCGPHRVEEVPDE